MHQVPNVLFTYNRKVLKGTQHGCVAYRGDREKFIDRQHGTPAGGDGSTHDEKPMVLRGREEKERRGGSWKVYSYSGEQSSVTQKCVM